MKRLLLLLTVFAIPAVVSAQTLSRETTDAWLDKMQQHHINSAQAGQDGDWVMACASQQKIAAILETVMTDLQFHYPDRDWMEARRANQRILNGPCQFGGY